MDLKKKKPLRIIEQESAHSRIIVSRIFFKKIRNQRAIEVEDRVLRNQRILSPLNRKKPQNDRSQLSRSGNLAR